MIGHRVQRIYSRRRAANTFDGFVAPKLGTRSASVADTACTVMCSPYIPRLLSNSGTFTIALMSTQQYNLPCIDHFFHNCTKDFEQTNLIGTRIERFFVDIRVHKMLIMEYLGRITSLTMTSCWGPMPAVEQQPCVQQTLLLVTGSFSRIESWK